MKNAEHWGSEGCGEVGEWVEWVENTEQGGYIRRKKRVEG